MLFRKKNMIKFLRAAAKPGSTTLIPFCKRMRRWSYSSRPTPASGVAFPPRARGQTWFHGQRGCLGWAWNRLSGNLRAPSCLPVHGKELSVSMEISAFVRGRRPHYKAGQVSVPKSWAKNKQPVEAFAWTVQPLPDWEVQVTINSESLYVNATLFLYAIFRETNCFGI